MRANVELVFPLPQASATCRGVYASGAGARYPSELEAGKPIEYDHLFIEHPKGRTEITLYSREISLLLGDNMTEPRIHRVCAILQGLRPS